MLATFLALPRWMHGLIGIALAVLAFLAWLHFHDKGVIAEHEAEVTKVITEKDAKADADARAKASGATSKLEAENDEARKAAAGSDDPLKSALDRLR